MRSTIAAVAFFVVGGLFIVLSPLITTDNWAGFLIYLLAGGTGFILAAIGSALVIPVRQASVGRVLLVSGSVLWFVGWSWFLHLGLVFPVPILFWALICAFLYLVAGMLFAASRSVVAAGVSLFLVAGSVVVFVIAISHPVYSSQFTYSPIGVAFILAGVVYTLNLRKLVAGA